MNKYKQIHKKLLGDYVSSFEYMNEFLKHIPTDILSKSYLYEAYNFKIVNKFIENELKTRTDIPDEYKLEMLSFNLFDENGVNDGK